MKVLIGYLKPYKWLVILTMVLASVNTIFSLIDPIIFGKIIKLAQDTNNQQDAGNPPLWTSFLKSVLLLLLLSMGTAMISRIAKNFQDYFINVITQKLNNLTSNMKESKIYVDASVLHKYCPMQTHFNIYKKTEEKTKKFTENLISG